MLVIEQQQIDVMSAYMLKQFENRMMIHLLAAFPQQTQGMPESALRAMVQGGMQRAAQYKVEFEDDIKRYLELMVVHGGSFDTDPRTTWAGRILRSDLHGSLKMDRIEEYAQYLEK